MAIGRYVADQQIIKNMSHHATQWSL